MIDDYVCLPAVRSRHGCCWEMTRMWRMKRVVTFWTTWARWNTTRLAASSRSLSATWSVRTRLFIVVMEVGIRLNCAKLWWPHFVQIHISIEHAALPWRTDCLCMHQVYVCKNYLWHVVLTTVMLFCMVFVIWSLIGGTLLYGWLFVTIRISTSQRQHVMHYTSS